MTRYCDVALVRHLMPEPMYWELMSIAAEVRDGGELEIARHTVRRDGYDRTGRYFGALATGERMYIAVTAHSRTFIRTRANLRQLKAALTVRTRL